jgi:hypothetical protein
MKKSKFSEHQIVNMLKEISVSQNVQYDWYFNGFKYIHKCYIIADSLKKRS